MQLDAVLYRKCPRCLLAECNWAEAFLLQTIGSPPVLRLKVAVEVRENFSTHAGDHPITSMTDTDTTIFPRPREGDAPAADQPPTKRQKLDVHQTQSSSEVVMAPLLPPSHALLGITRDGEPGGDGFTQMLETDVGISEYVGRDIPPIQAVIKQRYDGTSEAFSRYLYYISGSRIFWSLRSTKTTE